MSGARERLAALLIELWEEDAGEPIDGLDGVSEAIDSKLNAVPNLNGGLALFAVVSGLRARASDTRKASS